MADARATAAVAKAAIHLGRGFLLADQPDPAMDHLQAALDHGLSGGIEPHLPLLIALDAGPLFAGLQIDLQEIWSV
jgi:hypothetical protein